MDKQKSGKFRISVQGDRSFFVSQSIGSCESNRSKMDVTVGYSGLSIPNSITPNGDGINDEWLIKGLETYPNVKVVVFNRNGTKIFESND